MLSYVVDVVAASLFKTHCGRDEIYAILQTTFTNAFSWTKLYWFWIKISLKFISKGPIDNIPELVDIMAWRRPGDKPLSEPMIIILLTHICVNGLKIVCQTIISNGVLSSKEFHEKDMVPHMAGRKACSISHTLYGRTVFRWCPRVSLNRTSYTQGHMHRKIRTHG